MLFIDFEATKRIRVNGVASIDDADPLLVHYPEADLVVRVRAQEIFPNCPRYIHKMQMTELSAYAPRPESRAADARMEADGSVPRSPAASEVAALLSGPTVGLRCGGFDFQLEGEEWQASWHH